MLNQLYNTHFFLLNVNLLEGGAYREGETKLKFFNRQRQNYTMSMESEMLHSFNNNIELLRYTV